MRATLPIFEMKTAMDLRLRTWTGRELVILEDTTNQSLLSFFFHVLFKSTNVEMTSIHATFEAAALLVLESRFWSDRSGVPSTQSECSKQKKGAPPTSTGRSRGYQRFGNAFDPRCAAIIRFSSPYPSPSAMGTRRNQNEHKGIGKSPSFSLSLCLSGKYFRLINDCSSSERLRGNHHT